MIWVAVVILFALLYWESRRVSQSLRHVAKYGDEVVEKHETAIKELEKAQRELERTQQALEKRMHTELVCIARELDKVNDKLK